MIIPLIKQSFLALLIACSTFILNAQSTSPCDDFDPDSLMQFITLDDPIQTYYQDTFCIDLLTKNFNNIEAFQFTFSFDTSYLEFISLTTPPGQLHGPFAYNGLAQEEGYVGVIWINFEAYGISLPDSTQAITICLQAIKDSTVCSPVKFNEVDFYQHQTGIAYFVDGVLCSDSTLLVNGKDSLCIRIGEVETVSLEEIIGIEPYSFSVYPNPVTDFLSVQSNEEIDRVVIYDLWGRKVFEDSIVDMIDVSGLESGAYFLVAYTPDGLWGVERLVRL